MLVDFPERLDAATVDVERYRPMLRLLSRDDAELTADPAQRRKLRARRRDLFRDYLADLTGDHGKLLAGLRSVMTESSVDRPDLARAIEKHRVLFAAAVCRAEFHLWVYGLGIGKGEALKADVRHLVDALTAIQGRFHLVESAVWGG